MLAMPSLETSNDGYFDFTVVPLAQGLAELCQQRVSEEAEWWIHCHRSSHNGTRAVV